MSLTRRTFLPLLALLLPASMVSGFDLLGVHAETGDLYRISTDDGTATLASSTGLAGFGALEASPDGSLYGFTTGLDAGLFLIDPVDYTATEVGSLNLDFVFDGALVFAPDGTVYGTNHDSDQATELFTLDLATGNATIVGMIGSGQHDINGMTWRSDGVLAGIDRITNALVTIDPSSAALGSVAVLDPILGSVGGMTRAGDAVYFTTSGPGAGPAGSNELYTIDLFTGDHDLVGSLSPTITGVGISGLAVPEPATLMLLIMGGAAFWRRR